MTTDQSAGPHLDLDALADLLAAEGTDADVAHVGACARCSADLADLDAALGPVAAALAAAPPVPAPPADLDARLRSALALAPLPPAIPPAGRGASDAPTPDAEPTEPGPSEQRSRDVVPLRPRRTRRALPAVLGTAAASVALLAVVGLGIGVGGSNDSGDSAASSAEGGGSGSDDAGGGASAPDVSTSATGTDYGRDGRALALALPGLLAGGATPDQAGRPRQATRTGDPAPAAGSTEQLAADPLARLRDPAELAGCLSALTGPDVGGVPLALDYASFEGAPALVVVLPSARADRVDVYTVGAGCSAGGDQTLQFDRLPRP